MSNYSPEQSAKGGRPQQNNEVHADVRRQQKNDIWLVVLCARLLSALTLSTFFQPDEYYQSLEPAWQLSFGGSSGAWITWEWHHQLRSSLHPLLLACVYKVVSTFGWLFAFPPTLRAFCLIKGPCVTHGLATATLDYFTWRWAERLYGERSQESYVALALSLISPWQWFAGSRSLTNGLEAALTGVALFYWPWELLDRSLTASQRQYGPSKLKLSVVLAALAVILRPTNGLIWFILTGFTIFRANQSEALNLIQHISVYGTFILALSHGLDRIFYGVWTFPSARFFGFNVVQNLAVFYGRNRPDYYLTEGLPLLMMTALPFALVGLYQAARSKPVEQEPESKNNQAKSSNREQNAAVQQRPANALQPLAVVVIVMIGGLSLIGHKEIRFLYPLFPILILLAARPVHQFFAFTPFPHPLLASKKLLLAYMVIVNAVVAIYLSYIHQRGPIAVMAYLRTQFLAVNTDVFVFETRQVAPMSLFSFTMLHVAKAMGWETPRIEPLRGISAAFLMPCHSTPWRSHFVHPEIRAWALTCEPPIGLYGVEREAYMDEADEFYEDPGAWLRSNMSPVPTKERPWEDVGWDRRELVAGNGSESGDSAGGKRPWPRYVVFFEQLEPVMQEVIGGGQSRYEECWRTFNTHWHDDWRRKGDVIVWCVDGGVDMDSIVREHDEARERERERVYEL